MAIYSSNMASMPMKEMVMDCLLDQAAKKDPNFLPVLTQKIPMLPGAAMPLLKAGRSLDRLELEIKRRDAKKEHMGVLRMAELLCDVATPESAFPTLVEKMPNFKKDKANLQLPWLRDASDLAETVVNAIGLFHPFVKARGGGKEASRRRLGSWAPST